MNKYALIIPAVLSLIFSFYNVWFMWSFDFAIILGVIFAISTAVIFKEESEKLFETFIYSLGFAIVYILIFGVLVVARGVYCDKHTSKTILNFQPTREITFSDDTKSVHYKTGATETVFSEVYPSEEKYLKMKINYLQNNNCALYKYNMKYENILDKNQTIFECD